MSKLTCSGIILRDVFLDNNLFNLDIECSFVKCKINSFIAVKLKIKVLEIIVKNLPFN
ncbi:hypothetical protein Mh1964_07600 [Mannheimia haemolytica]